VGKFYRVRNNNQPAVWFYSERGVMSHAFGLCPTEVTDFLLTDAVNGINQSLREVVGTSDRSVLLTEFGFGNDGFGSPDGALFVQSGDRAFFVFIEAKVDLLRGCWGTPARFTATDLEAITPDQLDALCRSNVFNSALNGQLELRWRFVNAFRSSWTAARPLVRESARTVPEHIRASDRYYWRHRLQSRDDVATDWRRVSLDGGLDALGQLLNCVTDFYLLALTGDEQRPPQLDELRLCDGNGQALSDVNRRVFWAPFQRLADMVEVVPCTSPAT
jgi:hypothetical protein